MGICEKIECVKKEKTVWIILGLCGDRDECEEYCCCNPDVKEKKDNERKSTYPGGKNGIK